MNAGLFHKLLQLINVRLLCSRNLSFDCRSTVAVSFSIQPFNILQYATTTVGKNTQINIENLQEITSHSYIVQHWSPKDYIAQSFSVQSTTIAIFQLFSTNYQYETPSKAYRERYISKYHDACRVVWKIFPISRKSWNFLA